MMYTYKNYSYNTLGDHSTALDFLIEQKSQKKRFTVLDVGATASSWTAPVLDAVFDLYPASYAPIQFIGNINDTAAWKHLLEYVSENGKFSYSVCSHTLEDVAYPIVALNMLPLVSEAGLISVPSQFIEVKRNVEGPWRGYIHHRWIYCIKDEKLVVVPKISFVEQMEITENCPDDKTQLNIFWEKELPYSVLNNDYLGPNKDAVVQMYKDILC
jgi:hypothetical protein